MAHTLPTPWNVNYKGAIRVEAAQYGYLQKNNPKAWCLHTPEEPADATPSTPYYFHNTTRLASTHYFVAWTGLVFQMVPENEGAYANTRETGTRFSWETSANLNLQTINIEIEGYAHNITQTMPRGGIQWNSLIRLMTHRSVGLKFPVERTFGHKQVSSWRSDPGALRLDWIVQDVNKLLDIKQEEENMATFFIGRQGGGGGIFTLDGQHLNGARWASIKSGIESKGGTVEIIQKSKDDDFFKSSTTFPNGTV